MYLIMSRLCLNLHSVIDSDDLLLRIVLSLQFVRGILLNVRVLLQLCEDLKLIGSWMVVWLKDASLLRVVIAGWRPYVRWHGRHEFLLVKVRDGRSIKSVLF